MPTATAKLESERDKLEEESQGIQAAANELKLLLPAKAREAERAADVLLLAGKPAEAQAGPWSAESRVQPGPPACAGSAGFDFYTDAVWP